MLGILLKPAAHVIKNTVLGDRHFFGWVEITIAEETVKILELRVIGPVRLHGSRRNRTPMIE